MINANNILNYSEAKELESSFDLIESRTEKMKGAVNYSLLKYRAQYPTQIEDASMIVYHYDSQNAKENYLELRFCIISRRYCQTENCEDCNKSINCYEQFQDINIFAFRFVPSFLAQFTQNIKLSDRKDEVLAFRYGVSFTRHSPVCNRKRNVLEALFSHNYSGAFENIFINAKIHELLLYSLECLTDAREEVFTCKFLANDLDREKIMNAREILLQHIGNPLTIKELSRKVAINECYLKKGFKEIFGTTIFDFYQQQRMEHARYLLCEKGLNVTDVSFLLGYSSISHFSTAFKKHTGTKPCELLYSAK